MRTKNRVKSTPRMGIFVGLFLFGASLACGQVNFPTGRIAYSADGNQHDTDDWAATAVSCFMLDIAGMNSRLVHYDFADHMGNNNSNYENQMVTSALGGAQRFDLNQAIFFNDQSQLASAKANFQVKGNASSAGDRLWYICAGPMEVPWQCITQVDAGKRPYITVVSHSNWNNNHDDADNNHTWSDIQATGVQTIKIEDQNKNPGFNMPYSAWNWLNTSGDPDLVWLRGRIDATGKSNADCSDSGMMWYVLTGAGDEDGTPAKVQALWEASQSGIRAEAGPDQTLVVAPAPNVDVSLAGSVTSDNGLPYTSLWTKVTGPGTVTFADSASPATTATINQAGTYVLQLEAQDAIESDADTVTISIAYGGLVAHYEFEYDTLDSSGNNHHGTLVGRAGYSPGIVGARCAGFGGTDGYVDIPKSVNADFSIAAWVQMSQAPVGGTQWYSGIGLVDGEVGGVNADFGTSVLQGKFAFGVGNPDTTVSSSTSIDDGGWHHVVATRVASTGAMKVYVDGVEEGNSVGPTGNRDDTPSLRVGSILTGAASSFLRGGVDDLRLYDYPLTPAEITALINLGFDTLPPEVTIATPADGGYASEMEPIDVSGSAVDNRELVSVEFWIDGVLSDTTSNETFAFTAPAQSVGEHVLTVIGEDAEGLRGSDGVTINVYAGPVDTTSPVVAFTAPPYAAVSEWPNPVPVTLVALDDIAMSEVLLLVDGGAWAGRSDPPYTFTVTGLGPGAHLLVARGTDVNGNQFFTTNGVTVVLPDDTTPPQVAITSPLDGGSVFEGDPVNLSATVTDNLAVALVEFYADGILQQTAVEPPYTVLIPNLSEGAHVLSVIGVDLADNRATNTVSLTVIHLPSWDQGMSALDETMSSSTWFPWPNPMPPSPNAEYNFSTAGDVTATWNDGSGSNASLTYTVTRPTTSGPGIAALYYFSDITYTPAQDGPVSSLNMEVDLADQAHDMGLVRFALEQGSFLFYTSVAVYNEGRLALTMDGHQATLTLDGVAVGSGVTWVAQYPGSQPNFDDGGEITFGLHFTGRLAVSATTSSFGPILDNFLVEVNQPNAIFSWPAPGGMVLSWFGDRLLEQCPDLALNEWETVEDATSPYLVQGTGPYGFYRLLKVNTEPPPVDPLVFWATLDFPNMHAGDVPAYVDSGRNALAINTAQLPSADLGKFAAAEATFSATGGDYDITLTSLTERDGECTYRVYINGALVLDATNPQIYPSTDEYNEVDHTVTDVTVPAGATIRVEFNSDTNGLVPEGGSTGYARGRWRRLTFTPNLTAPTGAYIEAGGVVVMEIENTASPLGLWLKINPGDANYVSGATGSGHFEFTGNAPANGPPTSPLTFTFTISQAGNYALHLRARKRLAGAPSDQCNDAYVRMAGDFTSGSTHYGTGTLTQDTKLYGGNASNWGWANNLDGNGADHVPPIYTFKTGETYTLTVSGRSQRFNIDRIVLNHSTVGSSTWQNASESNRAP